MYLFLHIQLQLKHKFVGRKTINQNSVSYSCSGSNKKKKTLQHVVVMD
jgi:hypothetical protein